MQDITVEMILETVRKELNELEEKYRQSKSPKREWEVVAFARKGEMYKIVEGWQNIWVQPLYRGPVAQFTLHECMAPQNNCTIHSVRRLSDGEVFSVGERVDTPHNGKHAIDGFEMEGQDMLVKLCGGYLGFSAIRKLPQVLTTADGVDVCDSYMDLWVVGADDAISQHYAGNISLNANWNKIFSTPEAAEEYILNNRPLLSLNDVKEAWASDRSFVGTEWLIEKLTALVKQNLTNKRIQQ